MKALCLVAHPDDCVIFGYSYIHAHPQYHWTIGYLTYTAADPRGAEVQAFWQQRHIDTVFLGFEDHWHDNDTKTLTRWNELDAIEACQLLADRYDLVLTHNANGEYGHIHHCLVHRAVQHHPRVVVFCDHNRGTTYSVPPEQYSLAELPLHADIVQGFHMHSHCNNYEELK